MPDTKSILISLKTFSGKGTDVMRGALQRLQKEFQVSQVSSVYKVDRPAESLAGIRNIRKEEHLDGLAVVVMAKTVKSPQDTLEVLNEIERDLQKEALRRTISFNLLVYGNEIVMLPGLSLPHPEMHLRPEEIVLAVEVWGDYVHPVLKESLAKLSRRFANETWGEFYTQGRPLLDFLIS